jgi:hypothetical protein
VQPDLGLKMYQLCGRAAYLKLQRALTALNGKEEFTLNSSAALREQVHLFCFVLSHLPHLVSFCSIFVSFCSI